jgi:pimeloyl-ACP methyl ester carboxylesterase
VTGPDTRSADQLTPTRAIPATLPGRAGPLAALIAEPSAQAVARCTTGVPPSAAGVPTLLLLPGYTGSKEDFAPILDPLADGGLRAVAVDLPGQYQSPGPDDERAYTAEVLGGTLAAAADGLAACGPVVLVGHSLGGLVARSAVLAGAPVRGLVLLCSGPAAFRSGDRLAALAVGEPVLRRHGIEAAYRIRQSTRAAGVAPRPDLEEFLRHRFVGSSTAGLLGMAGMLRTEPDRTGELAAALRARGAGIAVLAGVADDAWPLRDQRDMARRLGTDLVLIPGAAHSPAVENPRALVALLLDAVGRFTARSAGPR